MDFALALFQKAKHHGVHTVIDTSGGPFSPAPDFLETFTRLLRYTDLFLLGIKHIEDGAHRRLTGKSNVSILDMAHFLSETGKPLWILHVLVPGFTDDDASLAGLKRFIETLQTVEKISAALPQTGYS
jgi:pyruvate formate lyase activating enzyme